MSLKVFFIPNLDGIINYVNPLIKVHGQTTNNNSFSKHIENMETNGFKSLKFLEEGILIINDLELTIR
jgi:hypothetical protein